MSRLKKAHEAPGATDSKIVHNELKFAQNKVCPYSFSVYIIEQQANARCRVSDVSPIQRYSNI